MKLGPAPGWLRPGRRIYAVGDIHGCRGQLAALHDAIRADRALRPVPSARVVHLGDYVDRGPDSAGVVAMLASGAPFLGTESLMGNHERTMLDALAGDRASARDWLFNGGGAALESWGAEPAHTPEAWAAAIPAGDLAWLRSRPLHYAEGGYLFVHAGIRPGVALADQLPDDLLCIRGSFLHSEADFGAVVVHGHTPRAAPEVRRNRIGIDTGAVYGGALSCAVLEGDRLGFLAA